MDNNSYKSAAFLVALLPIALGAGIVLQLLDTASIDWGRTMIVAVCWSVVVILAVFLARRR